MTTTPVHTITDEQIAEIELDCMSGVDVYTPRGIMRGLLARLREAEKDAARWKFVEKAGGSITLKLHNARPDYRESIIDTAMQGEQ